MKARNKLLVIGLMLFGLCLLSLWLSLTASAQAGYHQQQTNHCVRPDGMSGCFATIQAAVNASVDGDTITIAGGTYTESVTVTHTLAITGGWQPPGWPLPLHSQ